MSKTDELPVLWVIKTHGKQFVNGIVCCSREMAENGCNGKRDYIELVIPSTALQPIRTALKQLESLEPSLALVSPERVAREMARLSREAIRILDGILKGGSRCESAK